MAEVAKAYVTIIPTMQGAQQTITNELTGAGSKAGTKAGKSTGTSMVSQIGSTLSSAGASLTKGVTVPLAAIGVAAAASWKEVDAGLDTIQVKTGANAEQMAEFETIMNNIAKTVPIGFEDIGTAIGEVNTRFGLTGDALEDLCVQMIQFAEINGTDLNSTIDSTSKVMAAFGLSADDASGFLDALNVVGQQTGVDVATLSDQVAANAAQFQEMGLTAESAAALLGQADMAGLDASSMLVGLKTAMKKATSEGKTLDEALDAFSDTMNSNADESDKLAAAYELFGSRAGAAIYNAYEQGTLDLSNFTASIGDFEGSVSETFEATKDPVDSFTTALNTLKIAGADLIEAAGPAITTIANVALPILTSLVDAFTSMPEGIQTVIIVLGGLLAAIGPVLTMVGSFMTGIGGLTSAFSLLSGAGGITGFLAAAAPFLPWIALAVAAVIGVIEVIQHWDEIVNFFKKTWETVSEAISEIWDTLCETAIEVFETIGEFISSVWDTISSTASSIWNGILDTLSGIMDSISSYISSIWNGISETLGSVWNGISSTASTVWDGIQGIITGVADAVSSAWDTATSTVGDLVNGIGETVESAFSGIQTFISPIVDWLKGIFDFNWSLPSIALPHFSISGSFSLMPPSIPTISVSWYAKAAEEGALFDKPTIIGVGDAAQPEMLIGQDTLRNMISGETTITINVYGSEGQDVSELADLVADKIQSSIDRKEAAFA